VILATARLTLREMTETDAGFVLELLNEPGFLANIGDRGVRTLDQARGYIRERVIASYRTHGFGMWLAQAGEPIGMAGLVKRDGLDIPDLGYAILERHWGQGYASEAAAGVLRHAYKGLGLDRLAAITTPDNQPSQTVLRRVGFHFEKMIQIPGNSGENACFNWAAKA
jgi:[ribosomal protein S5]-alanine N-acetyltransferase